jgi:hypothetical protein
MEEHDWYDLLHQFNKENYETIDAFQGGWVINHPFMWRT